MSILSDCDKDKSAEEKLAAIDPTLFAVFNGHLAIDRSIQSFLFDVFHLIGFHLFFESRGGGVRVISRPVRSGDVAEICRVRVREARD